MRNIYEMTVIQIEATNLCNKSCSNCTRFCGHYTPDKIYFTPVDYIEKALYSLRNYRGMVGLIGGEPTLHPEFESICHLYKKYRARHQAGLWTNTLTPQYQKHKELICSVFGTQNINTHETQILHTPMLVSSDSLGISVEEKQRLIDNCWVEMTWSATITPKGAYFCEVAGMLSYLMNGPDGWSIEDEWWLKKLPEYKEQIEWACSKCGGAMPCIPRRCKDTIDDISADNLTRLEQVKSPKIMNGKYEIYNKELKFDQNRKCDWYWNDYK